MDRSTSAVRLLAGDKEPVRFMTTGNHTLSGLAAVNTDGVTPIAGDRALVSDQADASQNGIYTASAGIWRRAPDARSSRLMVGGMKVTVQEGATQRRSVWNLVTDRPNVGTDDIEYELFLNSSTADIINAAREVLVAQMDSIISTAMAAGKATSAEARAGVSNAGWMTPLRVAEFFDGRPAFSLPTGRISLSNTAAYPLSSVVGGSAQTIWLIDMGGGQLPHWSNALSRWTSQPFSGALSLNLDPDDDHLNYHNAGGNFDVYTINHPILGPILGTSGDGGLDFAGRGSSIANIILKNGIWVNSVPQYLRVTNTGNVEGVDYLFIPQFEATWHGSIGCYLDGQCEWSPVRKLVFNAYNPRDLTTLLKYTGIDYPANSGTPRQIAGDPAMETQMLFGLPGALVEILAQQYAVCAVAGSVFATYVGVNNLTPLADTESFGEYGRAIDTLGAFPTKFVWRGHNIGIGRKFFKWIETGNAAGCTFKTNGGLFRNGMSITARNI